MGPTEHGAEHRAISLRGATLPPDLTPRESTLEIRWNFVPLCEASAPNPSLGSPALHLESAKQALRPFAQTAATEISTENLLDVAGNCLTAAPDEFAERCTTEVLLPVLREIDRYEHEVNRRYRLVTDRQGAELARNALASQDPDGCTLWDERESWFHLACLMCTRDPSPQRRVHQYAKLAALIETFSKENETARYSARALRNPDGMPLTVLHLNRKWGVELTATDAAQVGIVHVLLADRLARGTGWQGWLSDRRVDPFLADVLRGKRQANGHVWRPEGCFDLLSWTSLREGENEMGWREGRAARSVFLSWSDEPGMLPYLGRRRVLILRDGEGVASVSGGHRAKLTRLRKLAPSKVETLFTRIHSAEHLDETRELEVRFQLDRLRQFLACQYPYYEAAMVGFAYELVAEVQRLPSETRGPLEAEVCAEAGILSRKWRESDELTFEWLGRAMELGSQLGQASRKVGHAYISLALMYFDSKRFTELDELLATHDAWIHQSDAAESAFANRVAARAYRESDPEKATRYARTFVARAEPLLGPDHPQIREWSSHLGH